MARRDEAPARREVPVIRIFLSSPGDVADERTQARQLIDNELPKLPSLRGRLALELIAWDDPVAQIPMLATETPQESVNAARPRPATCDIVIVILWSRMGTPLPDSICKSNGEPYLSGTEWEYEDAVNSARQPPPAVLVYRRTEEPKIGLRDPQKKEKEEQFERVEAFFGRLRSLKRGLNEYANSSDFRRLLSQHLQEMLYRRLQPASDDVQPTPTAAEIPDEYCNWLRRNFEKIELLGAKEGRTVTLNHVYVPALTQSSRNPITLLGRLDQESLYVSAPAGAGKSTFCRWAVLQSIAATDLTHPVPAPEEFTEPVPENLRTRLPLLVPLREFWRSMNCGRGERTWHRSDLEKALADWIDRAQLPGVTGALLRAHLNVGGAFLVFDGPRRGAGHPSRRGYDHLSARTAAQRPRRRVAGLAQEGFVGNPGRWPSSRRRQFRSAHQPSLRARRGRPASPGFAERAA